MITFMVIVIVIFMTAIVIITIKQYELLPIKPKNIHARLSLFEDFRW